MHQQQSCNTRATRKFQPWRLRAIDFQQRREGLHTLWSCWSSPALSAKPSPHYSSDVSIATNREEAKSEEETSIFAWNSGTSRNWRRIICVAFINHKATKIFIVVVNIIFKCLEFELDVLKGRNICEIFCWFSQLLPLRKWWDTENVQIWRNQITGNFSQHKWVCQKINGSYKFRLTHET